MILMIYMTSCMSSIVRHKMENETASSFPEGADLSSELLEPAELLSSDAGAQLGHFNIRTVIHNIPLTSIQCNAQEDAKLFVQSLLESKFKVTDSSVFEGMQIMLHIILCIYLIPFI